MGNDRGRHHRGAHVITLSHNLRTLLPPRIRRLSAAQQEQRYDLNQLQALEAMLNRHGRSFQRCAAILEFGCGHGRLTRHLARLAPHARISGCDVAGELVAACKRACPQGRFLTNEVMPPLGCEDAQFDCIYSYSVFTHLSEPTHRAWLAELAKKLRPGGVMLHTTHSYACLKRLAVFSPAALAKYALPSPVDDFLRAEPPYYYAVDNPLTPEYGLAVISRSYVTTRWPQYTGLRLTDYVEAAMEAYPEGCQDVVLLTQAG